MKKSLLLLFLLAAPTLALFSQTPASSTIQANHIRAVLNADGALFTDGQQGQFVPVEPGLAPLSLLRASGVWIAGVDPGGNLQGAVYTSAQSDFEPGILDQDGLPSNDLNKIWRVNCADINQDLLDFQDNGVLDNPNPQVLSWPGKGNPFFDQYNAPLSLPFTDQALAGYNDADDDATYNPSHGDYPSIEMRGCALNKIPNDMAWFVFRDVIPTAHPSNLKSIHMEIQTQVFAYETAAPSPLNNTLFVRYKLINRGYERMDSCFFGMYADFSIGNPNDDFVGCDTTKSIVYAYNGDPNDEGGFGAEAPVLGIDLLRGPIDTFGNEIALSNFVVVNNTDAFSPGTFYRVLTGSLPDGQPAPNNGLMYPGNPNDPAGQSEAALGNTPGHRVAVASFGPFTLLPGAVNELIVGYQYAWHTGLNAIQNVQQLLSENAAVQQLFDDCFVSADLQCNEIVAAPEAPELSGLLLYPNPAGGLCTLESKSVPLERIVITDMLGRRVRELELDKKALRYTFSVSDLAAGVYSVRAAGKEMLLAVQR